MNMKKILAVLVLMCLIIVPGCGSVESTESTTTAAEGESSESKTSASEEEQVSARPVIEKAMIVTRETDKDNKTVYVEGSHDRIRVSPESQEQYGKLSDALDQIMKKETEAYKTQVTEYLKARQENSENAMGENIPDMAKDQCFVRRADQEVLSLVERSTSYAGGAHGNTGFTTVNLDAQTGKEILLEDVIKDQNLLLKPLKEELIKKYGKDTFFDELDENIKSRLEGAEDIKPAWTLDPQGITFYYSDYDLAPYAAGTQNVTILYSAYADLFTDRYRPLEGEGYISGFCEYTDFSVDTNGDGENASVSVAYQTGDESDTMEGFEVKTGGMTVSVEDLYSFDINQYTVHTSTGKNFLYVWCSEENDWMTLYLFDISSGQPVSAGTADVRPNFTVDEGDEDYSIYREVLTDPNHMVLQTRFDLLSTYEGKKTYQAIENPKPETSDPYYIITSNITLESKKEITGDVVDEEGKVLEESVKIPSGSSFTLYRTDGKDLVDTRLKDGRLLRLKVEGTYPPSVNGTDGNELFEKLFYAG